MRGLECRLLCPELADGLAKLFEACVDDYGFFHPHPLTKEEAYRLANRDGRDMYYALLYEGKLIGYGFMRGKDEGYEYYSTGTLIHPEFRGKRCGEILKRFMYVSAWLRGADRVLLHIEKDNMRSLALNAKMGYEPFFDGRQFVGFCGLGPKTFAEKFDVLVREAVITLWNKAKDAKFENVPDKEFIATETVGEVIEKLIILNIRIWHLVGKALAIVDNAAVYSENQQRIAHCYKFKRPRLVVGLNQMLKALVKGHLDLAEDWDVKDYGGKE